MDFITIDVIYLVVVVIFGGLAWMMHRGWQRERHWRKEDQATCRMDIKSWQDKFDDEHAARIEFASLNTELTLQRDGLANSLLVFGNVYRELPDKVGKNIQGLLCELTGTAVVKPLTDITFVELGHYQIAAILTKYLVKNSA